MLRGDDAVRRELRTGRVTDIFDVTGAELRREHNIVDNDVSEGEDDDDDDDDVTAILNRIAVIESEDDDDDDDMNENAGVRGWEFLNFGKI